MPMNSNSIFRKRFDFSKIPATIQIPNLIEVQKRSYERFLQMDRLPSERDDAGLQAVFQSVFPITDFRNVSQLEFVDYAIGNWECKCGHLKVSITCAPLARIADPPSLPIRFIRATCFAASAARTTRTLLTFATSAATPSACN
jgi:DNA-directed RNA polymerase beta subunit